MKQARELLRRRIVVFVLGTFALALVAVVFLLVKRGTPDPWEFLLFWSFYAFAHRLPVEAKVRGIPLAGFEPKMPLVSVGFLVLLATAFATDPATAALMGLTTPLIPHLWRRGVVRSLFNSAQVSLYAGASSVAFHFFGRDGRVSAALIGAVVGSIVAIGINHTLVAAVMALERGRGFLGVWRELAWSVPNSLAFGLAAVLIAVLYRDAGTAAVAFMLVPLFVLRHARSGKGELDAARERTLWAFVRAVEVKDQYTSRHSERVAQIVVALHRKLGAPEDALERRMYGALLHDIGKVGVPARVLRKADGLTPDEWDVVKRHPGISAFVVQSVEFLEDLWPEVLYHHERLDGTGYPDGLTGDDIPKEARVLAVADTYEALTSNRPYRSALSQSEAIQELQRCAGTQLDAEAVGALVDLLADGHVFPSLPHREVDIAETVDISLAREA